MTKFNKLFVFMLRTYFNYELQLYSSSTYSLNGYDLFFANICSIFNKRYNKQWIVLFKWKIYSGMKMQFINEITYLDII